ncbi:hypothetical protein LXA43DRAFT_1069613 [Ganoderma leucocontextum]|nr:hypothetical protein LXA43DRAFT_1069613 [Ganoderma leucocontextum]
MALQVEGPMGMAGEDDGGWKGNSLQASSWETGGHLLSMSKLLNIDLGIRRRLPTKLKNHLIYLVNWEQLNLTRLKKEVRTEHQYPVQLEEARADGQDPYRQQRYTVSARTYAPLDFYPSNAHTLMADRRSRKGWSKIEQCDYRSSSVQEQYNANMHWAAELELECMHSGKDSAAGDASEGSLNQWADEKKSQI